MSFLDLLSKKGLLPEKSKDTVPQISVESGRTVETVLKQDFNISKADIGKAKAEYYNLAYRDLEGKEIPFEILNYIPEESAVYYKIIPVSINGGSLEVGIVDPENIEAMDALNFISSRIHMPFKVFIIAEDDFNQLLASYKGFSGEVTKALTDLETELSDDSLELEAGKKEGTPEESVNIIEDAPVTKIVATILRYAIDGGASDIHIEPMREKVRVRFRVDGLLNTSIMLPMKVHPAVVARIKILSDMRLDEKRKPQDGRFTARIEGRKIDFRVSTFPSYFGEKIVMRILDQEKGVKKLDDMGISPRNLEIIRRSITRPYGLILITGPTGSGKSTTLYSMLNELDREQENVLSLEDPVEYNIEGMTQSQVHPEIGYTFATGLRTTLRQDPDVIMVGEIRDKETAQLAIQAALTGHLVFSTLHTNTALGAIPRLIDMGIEPYLIAPTLVMSMAQRLVAQICPGTGRPLAVEGSFQMMMDKEFEDLPQEFRDQLPHEKEVFAVQPTPDCPKGTRGRLAVCEVFEMTSELERGILANGTENTLWPIVRRNGMLTMKEDAIIKALEKKIPFEEINKL